MTIVAVETVRVAEVPNLLLVRVHTDAGLVGLGETYYGAAAVETHLHEALAPALVGRPEPVTTEDVAELLRPGWGYVGYLGTGVEVRARSALDIALWDLLGRRTGQSVAQLAGGQIRNRVVTYNTCAGPHYMRGTGGQRTTNWGLPLATTPARHEDLDAFMHRADLLAADLLASGTRAMKIWPLDPLAERTQGRSVSDADLHEALEPVRKIRNAVGAAMDIMVEMHALWEPEPAAAILDALAPFTPRWVEDPIRPDRYEDLRTLRRNSPVPLAGGETLGGSTAVAPLLAARAVDVLIADLAWCGGVTEALRLAAATATASTEFSLHDCSGPVVLAASAQLACAVPHIRIQESTRAYYDSWYAQLATGLPVLTGGHLEPAATAGHGVELLPHVLHRPDVSVRVTGSVPRGADSRPPVTRRDAVHS